MTAPELLAAALCESFRDGPHLCLYCGARCAEHNLAATFVQKSFTGLDTVAAPGSSFVCDGCLICLRESATIALADGERRSGQKTRCYSWLFNRDGARAATKAHREQITSFCLDPPEPPFVICLSESGQKHLLYRARVCHSREQVVATLESEVIYYRPDELESRLATCKMLAAVCGKPALSEPLSPSRGMQVVSRWGEAAGLILLTEWMAVRDDALTRLALFLCPGKDECEREYEQRNAALGRG